MTVPALEARSATGWPASWTRTYEPGSYFELWVSPWGHIRCTCPSFTYRSLSRNAEASRRVAPCGYRAIGMVQDTGAVTRMRKASYLFSGHEIRILLETLDPLLPLRL